MVSQVITTWCCWPTPPCSPFLIIIIMITDLYSAFRSEDTEALVSGWGFHRYANSLHYHSLHGTAYLCKYYCTNSPNSLKARSKLHRTYRPIRQLIRIHSTMDSFCYCTERFYNKILKFQVSVFIDKKFNQIMLLNDKL